MYGNIYTLTVYDTVMTVECLSCGHRAMFTPRQLMSVASHGAEMDSLDYLLRRMRCSTCGRKELEGHQLRKEHEARLWVAEEIVRSTH